MELFEGTPVVSLRFDDLNTTVWLTIGLGDTVVRALHDWAYDCPEDIRAATKANAERQLREHARAAQRGDCAGLASFFRATIAPRRAEGSASRAGVDVEVGRKGAEPNGGTPYVRAALGADAWAQVLRQLLGERA